MDEPQSLGIYVYDRNKHDSEDGQLLLFLVLVGIVL